MESTQPKSKRSFGWILKSAFIVWLRPLEFTKRDQMAFVIVNTIIIDLFVLLTVWPETMMSGVSPWFPALFGLATATPVAIVMMTLGGNSLREILKLRSDLETISDRLTERNAELEVTKAELDKLAHSDGLTGVANRRSFSEALHDLFGPDAKADGRTWLAMLDLDGFKAVNDTYGHDAGDQILIGFADRLQKILGDNEGTIARFGGDEFVVILKDPAFDSAEMVERRARSLCSYLSADYAYRGEVLKIGVSVGIARLDESFETPEALLKAADTALLRAKANGKGRVCRHGAEDEPGKPSERPRLLRWK